MINDPWSISFTVEREIGDSVPGELEEDTLVSAAGEDSISGSAGEDDSLITESGEDSTVTVADDSISEDDAPSDSTAATESDDAIEALAAALEDLYAGPTA